MNSSLPVISDYELNELTLFIISLVFVTILVGCYSLYMETPKGWQRKKFFATACIVCGVVAILWLLGTIGFILSKW